MIRPSEAMAQLARAQALSMIRGRRNMRGAPPGWSAEQWLDMMKGLVKKAREAGITEEELRAAGFEAEELA
jgi:hypothetical protein